MRDIVLVYETGKNRSDFDADNRFLFSGLFSLANLGEIETPELYELASDMAEELLFSGRGGANLSHLRRVQLFVSRKLAATCGSTRTGYYRY